MKGKGWQHRSSKLATGTLPFPDFTCTMEANVSKVIICFLFLLFRNVGGGILNIFPLFSYEMR